MKFSWRDGNRLQLLENGEEFFPRVFEAIRQAQKEVLLETFIVYQDKVGNELRDVLIEAAERGVRVDITLDGYGCADLSADYIAGLTSAGVRLHLFDPQPKFLGMRTNLFRRLHRKIVVIDGERAFIGGINYSADHLGDFGPEAKQDYAVEIEGPAVDDIHRFALKTIAPREHPRRWWQRRVQESIGRTYNHSRGNARVLLVTRDNENHRDDIEEHYLEAIRSARSHLVIANAYFFPGYRLLREIRNAARRGVRVRLILQGQPDMPIAKLAARMLYNYLLRDGVQIFEYCRRPLHGKVALADHDWATVGSSNLDPLSLSLNLEANVIVRDPVFNRHLHERLDLLIQNHCKSVPLERMVRGYFWRAPLVFLIFHFLRYFPSMIAKLPASTPRLALVEPPAEDSPAVANLQRDGQ